MSFDAMRRAFFEAGACRDAMGALIDGSNNDRLQQPVRDKSWALPDIEKVC